MGCWESIQSAFSSTSWVLEPDAVDCQMSMRDGVDISTWGQLRFDEYVTGQFYVSFDSAFSTTHTFIGTKGKLFMTHPYTNPDACRIYIEDLQDQITEIEVPRASAYALEVEDLNDVVLNVDQPLVSLDRTRSHLNTVLRLFEAAGQG